MKTIQKLKHVFKRIQIRILFYIFLFSALPDMVAAFGLISVYNKSKEDDKVCSKKSKVFIIEKTIEKEFKKEAKK